MTEYKKHSPILPILAIMLGIALIVGVFLIPNDIFTKKPDEPTSPLEAYVFTDCKISIMYSSFWYGDYGHIAYLSDFDRAKILSLLDAVIFNEAYVDEHFLISGGSAYQYMFHLANGETVRMGFHNPGTISYREYNILGTLAIEGTGYGCHTWLSNFTELYQTEVDYFLTLYKDEVHSADNFPQFSQLRIIDLANAVTVETDAFRDTVTLEQVRLGEGLQTLRSGAFVGCRNLKEVYFKGNPETIEPGAFESGVTIYGPVGGTVEAYAKAEGLTFLPLPEIIPPMT